MVYKVGKGRGPWHTNRETQGTSTTSLISVGAKVASIGHSYVMAGAAGGSATASNPQIYSHSRGTIAQLVTINPAFRHDVRFGFNLASLTGTFTGTWTPGDTVTQAATGFSGTLLSANAGHIVVGSPTGTFTTAAVASSSGGTSTSISTADINNVLGYAQGLVGDMIQPLAGYPGASSRVTKLSALANAPDFIEIDTLVNSLLNGRTGAQAVTDLQTLVASVRAAFPNAVISVWNCAGFTSDSGFNTVTNRQRIADCNKGLVTAVPTWPLYGTKLFLHDQFSIPLASPIDINTDSDAYAAGTTYPVKVSWYYDTLHPAQRYSAAKAAILNNTWSPKIVAGNWFATTYLGTTNSITNPNALLTGTAGAVSGTSVTKAISSNGAMVGANPLAQVPTGMTVTGPSSASTVKCWTEDDPDTSGGRRLCIECTNSGLTEQVTITPNTVTGGVAVSGNTSWVRFYAKVWHDASGMASQMLSQLAVLSNQKSQCMVTDAITTAPTESKRLPQVAMTRYFVTPHYQLDGSQNANLKLGIQINWANDNPGTQVFKLSCGMWLGAVTAPDF